MSIPKEISDLLDKLIADGSKLVEGSYASRGGLRTITDIDGLRRWSNELILFKSLCGAAIRPWSERLVHNGTVIICSDLDKPLSALKTIRYAMDRGLLTSYEELVIAENFADLFEQGSYLCSQGYFLAAGVIFRAVLEERLRRLCSKHGCMPPKDQPTIWRTGRSQLRKLIAWEAQLTPAMKHSSL